MIISPIIITILNNFTELETLLLLQLLLPPLLHITINIIIPLPGALLIRPNRIIIIIIIREGRGWLCEVVFRWHPCMLIIIIGIQWIYWIDETSCLHMIIEYDYIYPDPSNGRPYENICPPQINTTVAVCCSHSFLWQKLQNYIKNIRTFS